MSTLKWLAGKASRTAKHCLVCSLIFASGPGTADDLNWVVAPYLWGSDVSLDLAINNDPVLGNQASFSDLLDKLDTAFMGHAEVYGERFGGLFDIVYIDLRDGQTVPVGPGGPILGDLVVDTGLKLQMFELGGFYRFPAQSPTQPNFDLLLGARRINADVSVDITLPGPGASPASIRSDNSETDVFAGARVLGNFNDRWGYKARIDYGIGGSEGGIQRARGGWLHLWTDGSFHAGSRLSLFHCRARENTWRDGRGAG